MRVYGIIPARMESTRLPRKLLLSQTGHPLIEYTWRAAIRAKSLDYVLVATDSSEIKLAVESFGGQCEITGAHCCGTDRIAEVAARCCSDGDIFVNIQGDEPEIDPLYIDVLVDTLVKCPDADMATLAVPIAWPDDLLSPSRVKVVMTPQGRAIYFSRSPLLGSYLHVGVYAYRSGSLKLLAAMPPSRLEALESLEQLRAIEAGCHIQVAIVPRCVVGIDTPEDYDGFVRRCALAEDKMR